jgi:hypothetical protein
MKTKAFAFLTLCWLGILGRAEGVTTMKFLRRTVTLEGHRYRVGEHMGRLFLKGHGILTEAYLPEGASALADDFRQQCADALAKYRECRRQASKAVRHTLLGPPAAPPEPAEAPTEEIARVLPDAPAVPPDATGAALISLVERYRTALQQVLAMATDHRGEPQARLHEVAILARLALEG